MRETPLFWPVKSLKVIIRSSPMPPNSSLKCWTARLMKESGLLLVWSRMDGSSHESSSSFWSKARTTTVRCAVRAGFCATPLRYLSSHTKGQDDGEGRAAPEYHLVLGAGATIAVAVL